MDVMTAILERTSYRGRYEEVPVPEADLKRILEAGLAAPSGCNKQTVSLIAVNDAELLALRCCRTAGRPPGSRDDLCVDAADSGLPGPLFQCAGLFRRD